MENIGMKEMIRSTGIVLGCLFLGGFLLLFITSCSRDINDSLDNLSNSINEYKIHNEAIDNITAGIISKKEIVNGYEKASGGPNYIWGSNGMSGMVMGNNNTEYIATQYRLYITAECEINGEVITVEKYYDVPVDVYREYSVGDYFDSQDF